MATRKKAKKTGKTQKNKPNVPQAPEGSKSVRSASADGYFAVEEGAWIQGVALGRYPKTSGEFPGFYYQLKLTEPCEFIRKKGDDGDYYDSDAEIGEIISVDERSIMMGLQPYIEEAPDKLYEVWIVFEEMQKNGRRKFWKGDARIVKPVEIGDVPF